MSDYTDSAEWREWERNVQERLLPALKGSAVTMTLAPDEPDAKTAVELGMSILLDKPIIVLVPPGRKVPAKLVELADAVIEADPNTPGGAAEIKRMIQERLSELIGPPSGG